MPGSGVSKRAAKIAKELAIVCTQLPKVRCDALVGITPRFEKYSLTKTREADRATSKCSGADLITVSLDHDDKSDRCILFG